jgi:hypothetical protein
VQATGIAVAEIRCAPAGVADTLDYTQLASLDDLYQLYDAAVALMGVDRPKTDCQHGPSVESWALNGATAGQLACYPDSSPGTGITFMWTDDALLVLARADAAGADYPTLYTWWTQAGPQP